MVPMKHPYRNDSAANRLHISLAKAEDINDFAATDYISEVQGSKGSGTRRFTLVLFDTRGGDCIFLSPINQDVLMTLQILSFPFLITRKTALQILI